MKTLDQIKAEMLENLNSFEKPVKYPTEKSGEFLATKHWLSKLNSLEPEDAKLQRVREKVEWINHSYNAYGIKDEVLKIIDAELTNKEQKVEMKKQKIEVEVEIPEGFEIEYHDIKKTNSIGVKASMFSGCVSFRLIQPPLELESTLFQSFNKDEGVRYLSLRNGTLEIETHIYSKAEARDLAKILNYWAETGKLPERVVVKNN